MARSSKSKAPETLTLKPSEMRIAVTHIIKAVQGGHPVSPFIWGPPGIGKSAIIAQVAKEFGYEFRDIRLSQMDPTDLRGIPYPGQDEDGNNAMYWSPPNFYNRNHDLQTLYFFDEMNAAPQSIQAAAYQIILDRQIGDYKIGPKDVVIAAGNRDTDKGSTFKMPTPLMNRFDHIEMRHDFEDWQEWAIDSGIHKTVVGYLSWQKHELMNFDPGSASRGFPTPRSWEFVSRLVHDDPDLPEMVKLAMLGGAVGDGVAIKFMEYQKLNEKLPNPSDILSGKVKELSDDQKEVSIMYSLTIGLCYELREGYDLALAEKKNGKSDKFDAWVKQADTFFGFMLDQFQPEMAVLGSRTILSTFKIRIVPPKMPRWKDFSKKYNKLILDN